MLDTIFYHESPASGHVVSSPPAARIKDKLKKLLAAEGETTLRDRWKGLEGPMETQGLDIG